VTPSLSAFEAAQGLLRFPTRRLREPKLLSSHLNPFSLQISAVAEPPPVSKSSKRLRCLFN
jgi:hypothetical protein